MLSGQDLHYSFGKTFSKSLLVKLFLKAYSFGKTFKKSFSITWCIFVIYNYLLLAPIYCEIYQKFITLVWFVKIKMNFSRIAVNTCIINF